jgi:sec-independent protein translocase protein TatA
MLGTLGMPELIVIGIVLLLIFGPKQLPKLGQSLGQTIKEFRNVGKEIEKIHNDQD